MKLIEIGNKIRSKETAKKVIKWLKTTDNLEIDKVYDILNKAVITGKLPDDLVNDVKKFTDPEYKLYSEPGLELKYYMDGNIVATISYDHPIWNEEGIDENEDEFI